MKTSYHVHSVFSDGKNTIPEVVSAAASARLDEVGISDHLVLLPGGQTVTWSMSVDDLPRYFETIKQAAANAPEGLTVRAGLEIDFVPETIGILPDMLADLPLDYVIGSVHFFGGFPIDECREKWDRISDQEKDDVIRGYWDTIGHMARTGLFDIAAHLDLYKKFGHLPTVDVSEDIIAAIDSIAGSSMSVEINTSGWYKPIHEAYPSSAILRGCRRRNIPVLITADAHRIDELTRDYDRAESTIKGVGYSQAAAYQNRKISAYPLSE